MRIRQKEIRKARKRQEERVKAEIRQARKPVGGATKTRSRKKPAE